MFGDLADAIRAPVRIEMDLMRVALVVVRNGTIDVYDQCKEALETLRRECPHLNTHISLALRAKWRNDGM